MQPSMHGSARSADSISWSERSGVLALWALWCFGCKGRSVLREPDGAGSFLRRAAIKPRCAGGGGFCESACPYILAVRSRNLAQRFETEIDFELEISTWLRSVLRGIARRSRPCARRFEACWRGRRQAPSDALTSHLGPTSSA